MMHRAAVCQMATTIIVQLSPLFCPQNNLSGNKISVSCQKCELSLSWCDRVNFFHCTVLNVAAADVLQLNLNAESKETQPRRKCPTVGSPSRRGPAQWCGAEAGHDNAMMEEERRWRKDSAPPLFCGERLVLQGWFFYTNSAHSCQFLFIEAILAINNRAKRFRSIQVNALLV